jgi:hypothetical protein
VRPTLPTCLSANWPGSVEPFPDEGRACTVPRLILASSPAQAGAPTYPAPLDQISTRADPAGSAKGNFSYGPVPLGCLTPELLGRAGDGQERSDDPKLRATRGPGAKRSIVNQLGRTTKESYQPYNLSVSYF